MILSLSIRNRMCYLYLRFSRYAQPTVMLKSIITPPLVVISSFRYVLNQYAISRRCLHSRIVYNVSIYTIFFVKLLLNWTFYDFLAHCDHINNKQNIAKSLFFVNSTFVLRVIFQQKVRQNSSVSLFDQPNSKN